MNERLYTVVDDYSDEDFETFETDDGYELEFRKPVECPRPHEWEAYCMARWGEVKEFFLPATGRIYKSRSSAVARADLINYWGGKARVLECTPRWESLDVARRRRQRERLEREREKAVGKAIELKNRIRELS